VCQGKSDDFGVAFYEAGLCSRTSPSYCAGWSQFDHLRYGDGASVISMGRTFLSHSNVVFIPVTAGGTKARVRLIWPTPLGLRRTAMLSSPRQTLTTPRRQSISTAAGYAGVCSYCGHDLPNNLMAQIDKVIGVAAMWLLWSARSISIHECPASFHLPMVESVGLEGVRIQTTAASGTGLVFKNVNLEAAPTAGYTTLRAIWPWIRSHIYLSDVYGSESATTT